MFVLIGFALMLTMFFWKINENSSYLSLLR
nr:hypothetical protein [Anoxybacillus tepidamans]